MSLKNVRVLNAVGTTIFVVLCWLPSFGPGANSWKIRLICVLFLLPLFAASACFYLVNLKGSRKPEGTTPKYFHTLKKICRIGVILTTLFFTIGIILPLEWSGLKALRGETLESVSGQVTNNDVTFATWFLAQDISIGNKENQSDLCYYLGSSPIRIGHRYNFLILPGYHIILQHTEINEK